jgi:hypothetical protein
VGHRSFVVLKGSARVEGEEEVTSFVIDEQGGITLGKLHEKIEKTEIPRARTIETTTTQMMA